MRIIKRPSVFVVWGILCLCLLPNAPAQDMNGYTVISAVELKKLQDEEKGILLVDTLAYSKYKQEHIAGAKHFEFPNEKMDPWDKSKTGGKSQEEFIGLLGEDKGKPIVFYCLDAK